MSIPNTAIVGGPKYFNIPSQLHHQEDIRLTNGGVNGAFLMIIN